jgi:hypothetical protein
MQSSIVTEGVASSAAELLEVKSAVQLLNEGMHLTDTEVRAVMRELLGRIERLEKIVADK